jgi:putative ABC transport system permease protein
VRRADAKQWDIRQQFLTEAVTLSLVGGVAGVLLGVGFAQLVGAVSPFPTAFSPWSVVAGLGVASAVGLFFGSYPAFKAARLDPIEALRYE